MGIELNTGQLEGLLKGEAWWKTKNKQVFEVSGGAGMGKTFLIRYLIDRIGLSDDEVLYVAYMGKAVSQLAKNGLPAKTIHSTIYDYEQVPARDDNGALIFKKNGKVKMIGKFILKDNLKKKIKLIIVDEGSTVEKKIAKDLLSFGIPTIVLGDLNQLQPPFGSSMFLEHPDVILTQVMRQEEDSPIVYLAHQALKGTGLRIGVYGNSSVITKRDLSDYNFKQADIVLTGTNKLRYQINNYYRTDIKNYKTLEFPHIGEKLICRKNNWDRELSKGIFLTNGTSGICEYFDRQSYNGRSCKIDFKPDFINKTIRNISIDYKRLLTQNLSELNEDNTNTLYNQLDMFEYAYAITVHSSQGSQYPNVLILNENFLSDTDYRRWLYTAITRAQKRVTIVL